VFSLFRWCSGVHSRSGQLCGTPVQHNSSHLHGPGSTRSLLQKWFSDSHLQIFFGVPHLATCIFLFFYNEPELGVGIDPGMTLTPLSYSIGQGSNPRPSDHKPSALPLDHSFQWRSQIFYSISKGRDIIYELSILTKF